MNIYDYSELTDSSKMKANTYYFNHLFYIDIEEFNGVFQILEHFGIFKKNMASYSHIYDSDRFDNIIGKRAIAYFENNLFTHYRIRYKSKERWRLSKYGSSYRAGKIIPCPFTGVCFDDDYINYINESLKEMNNSVTDILNGLLELRKRLIESEEEYMSTDEYISEYFESNEYKFFQDGTIYK